MQSVRKHGPIQLFLTIILAAALLLAGCAPGGQATSVATAIPVTGNSTPLPDSQTPANAIPEGLTPAVQVVDQPVTNGTVTIDEVTSSGPGWIVIHINNGGKPGEIIGWAPVITGINIKVPVTVSAAKATPVLYAMLHVDAGTVGTYEFPGADVPVTFQGQMVSPPFAVTGAGGPVAEAPANTEAAATAAPNATDAPPATAAPPAAATATSAPDGGGYGNPADTATPASGGAPDSGPATVSVADNAKLGKILVDSKGMTLYTFLKDTPGQTTCTGGCLENWPALLIAAGSPIGGEGVTGKLGQLTRPDNGTQVTYKDLPLYYFAGDQAPGDVNGQGIGNSWFAAVP